MTELILIWIAIELTKCADKLSTIASVMDDYQILGRLYKSMTDLENESTLSLKIEGINIMRSYEWWSYISDDFKELNDELIIEDLKACLEMFENGEILEAAEIMNNIAYAIFQLKNE